VIFVTVGTHHQRFERLLEALGPLAKLDELVVQHGMGLAPVEAHTAVPFMSHAEVVSHMERARAVVSHAGVGSVLLARRTGHTPVVVPRLRDHDEHVDDHQLAFVCALEREGLVTVVLDVGRLGEAVLMARRGRARNHPASGTLPMAVRCALDGEPVGAPAPGRLSRVPAFR
jgi:UDP-N-acetylglucosamine transferase subunit ALG13